MTRSLGMVPLVIWSLVPLLTTELQPRTHRTPRRNASHGTHHIAHANPGHPTSTAQQPCDRPPAHPTPLVSLIHNLADRLWSLVGGKSRRKTSCRSLVAMCSSGPPASTTTTEPTSVLRMVHLRRHVSPWTDGPINCFCRSWWIC